MGAGSATATGAGVLARRPQPFRDAGELDRLAQQVSGVAPGVSATIAGPDRLVLPGDFRHALDHVESVLPAPASPPLGNRWGHAGELQRTKRDEASACAKP